MYKLFFIAFTCYIFSVSADNILSFQEVPVPTTNEEKHQILASTKVIVTKEIDYHTIARSGDQIGKTENNIFGKIYDIDGDPLLEEDYSHTISNANDHSSLLVKDNQIFMISQFESRPSAIYITQLSQDQDGFLTAQETKPINLAFVRGGWVHCAGMPTPWMSHLGSEEYEPDARLVDFLTGKKAKENSPTLDSTAPDFKEDNYYGAMKQYFGCRDNCPQLNPYDYGYPIEIQIISTDMGNTKFAQNTKVIKHYAMGRTANELSYVMPDQKTVYISDDGTNTGFYKFIADNPQDLSAGTLYAAKFNQLGEEHSFTIDWINLGHANNEEIKSHLNITFSDIFEVATPINNACPVGFKGVTHGHRATFRGIYHECLKLKPGMEKIASRLETRRYAALKGATTELRKEEGITFHAKTNTLYLAMSEVKKGMEKNIEGSNDEYDLFTGDHIQVEKNNCGIVYALDVDENYNVTTMKPLIEGIAKKYEQDSPYFGNHCDIDNIANPDNLTMIPSYDTLIIGEDTGKGHQNDVIWAYDLNTKKLTRIQTTPYGSETTSPFFYENINGYAYLISVVQHPYGESDAIYENKDYPEHTPLQEKAYTGYIGPFPALR